MVIKTVGRDFVTWLPIVAIKVVTHSTFLTFIARVHMDVPEFIGSKYHLAVHSQVQQGPARDSDSSSEQCIEGEDDAVFPAVS